MLMNMAEEPHLYANFAANSELGMHGFADFFLAGALPHDDVEDVAGLAPQPEHNHWHQQHQQGQSFFPSGAVSDTGVGGGGLSLSLFNPKVAVAVAGAGLPQQPFHLPAPSPPAAMIEAAVYPDHHHHHHPSSRQLGSSKYLASTRELLGEFCNLAGASSTHIDRRRLLHDHPSPSSTLLSMDILELQKRKARLISMLDEVDRRYRRYCEQMRAVAAAFEAVAGGEGAASVYTAMALKAMSRHFRCLRDGIAGQIRVARKAMGERDVPVAPGTTMGETPRLKLLDQCLRQQQRAAAAIHDGAGGFMDSGGGHPWRPQRGLPERSVSVLRAWLFEHFLHPYPSDVDKHILARQTSLSRSQVSNWFINARVRLWKPMVEEMYMEEFKDHDNNNTTNDNQLSSSTLAAAATAAAATGIHAAGTLPPQLLNPKPSSSGFLLNDSESLSSVISSSGAGHPYHHQKQQQQQQQMAAPARASPAAESFSGGGAVSHLDYNFHPYRVGGGGSGGVVSLTLGLKHHGAAINVVGGMSMSSFSPAPVSNQQSIFFNGGGVGGGREDCQPVVPFSILVDGEAQNLPYRNLMGAQLLNDFA